MVVDFSIDNFGYQPISISKFKKGDLLPYYSKMINIQIDKYRIDR